MSQSSHPKKNKPTPVVLSPGTRVGAYIIERPLGSGGMAEVYYGIHRELERPAAIKILRASLATDEVHLQRFMQEARAAASLVHPNIVQVYDVGQDGEHRYIAQEFIAGSNLRQYLSLRTDLSAEERAAQLANANTGEMSPPINDRQLSIKETLSILLQVLAALNKSATSGIVHRDIKPENIMLTPDGDVKVTDFGLARVLLGDDPQLTRAGTTLGTPMYMSPEQIQEGEVDIRSDLYSLGVTLYHMLCGRPPFTGETPLALAMQHVQATVPDTSSLRQDIPPSLVELISRLLHKRPSDRFSSPKEVLDYLLSHRLGDLAGHWPDQTLPLPGVALARGTGPSQATLALQSRLRQSKRAKKKKIFAVLAVAVYLMGAFAVGALVAFSPPLQLFESTSESFQGIEKKSNVEEQYRWALLNPGPRDKWMAIEHFFPKKDGQLNRYYAGLADLQMAREHWQLGDEEEARENLRRTLSDPQMDAVIRALAHLQTAVIEEELDRTNERDAALDRALALVASDQTSSTDKKRLDDNVRLLSQSIQDYWFAARQ